MLKFHPLHYVRVIAHGDDHIFEQNNLINPWKCDCNACVKMVDEGNM